MSFLRLLKNKMIKKIICLISFIFVQYCYSHSILFVCDKFPWYTKKATFNQIISLYGKGHNIDVWSQNKVNDAINLDIIYGPGSSELLKKTVGNVFSFQKNINFFKYDTIICQYGHIGKEVLQLRREQRFNAKILICFRGNDITSVKEIPQYKKDFYDADGFLPVCKYFGYLLSVLGFPEEKTWVVSSGINIKHFLKKKQKIKNQITITFVGRLINKKGVSMCLKAFIELLEKHNNAKLFIVGDGIKKKSLKKMVEKKGINKKVKFFGWLNYNEYLRVLACSDLVVVPSVTTSTGSQEGIANVLKEAMLMQIPVITTFHAGNRELICHGKNGILVPEQSVYDLVKIMRQLIKDSDKRKKIGKAGRKIVEKKFSLKAVGKQLDQALQKILVT